MKLHSGSLYWPAQASQSKSYAPFQQSSTCDVLIVGGGMSGALTAYRLSQSGLNVLLLEKHRIGFGSSSANTGLIQYASDKTLTSCIHTFGEEKGVRFYNLSRDAVRELSKISSQLKGSHYLIPRSSLYYASRTEDVEQLREEYETLNRYGFPAAWMERSDIEQRFPFSKEAAIYTSGDAEMNAYAFIQALIEAAAANGVRVHEESSVTRYEKEHDSVRCYSNGHEIKARHVIIATGYETQEMKKDRGAYLTQSFALVTEPVSFLDQWYERCLIWETARPYLYVRTTPEQRIIVGGMDEPIGPGGLEEARFLSRRERLLEELVKLFPQAAGVQAEYAWGAVFGQTHDGLPYIGEHPDYPGCWFIENYGGNGTVYSVIAANLIAQTLSGHDNRDLEMFSLLRPSKPAPPNRV
jgi:glycine/D-amino acid oxidase-like deaminating enzyme